MGLNETQSEVNKNSKVSQVVEGFEDGLRSKGYFELPENSQFDNSSVLSQLESNLAILENLQGKFSYLMKELKSVILK